MAIITVVRNNFLGLMIDGYLPEFNALKEQYRNNVQNVKKYSGYELGKLKKIASFGKVSDKNFLSFYYYLTRVIQNDFCRYIKPIHNKCYHMIHTSQKDLNGYAPCGHLMKKYFQQTSIKNYSNDQGERARYINNIFIYPLESDRYCRNFIECLYNIINRTGFKVKSRNEYTNFRAFEKAWTQGLYKFLDDHGL
jgi:hypothetical protein